VSYQYHVLKNPTGLLGLTQRNGQFYLYIADTGNHVIRAFNPYTGLYVVAGSVGNAGYVNGDPFSARFNSPTGLTGRNNSWRECEYDPDIHRLFCWWNNYQEIYVDDTLNYVVRELELGDLPNYDPEVVSTACGSNVNGMADGASLSAQYGPLGGITDNGDGTYYVADPGNNRVRMWDDNYSNVSTFAGDGTDGFQDGYRSSAQFSSPGKLTSDGAGNLFVADIENNAIRMIDAGGNVTTLAGGGPSQPGYTDGQGSSASFTRPTSVACANGMIYVADSHNNVIRQIDMAGNTTTYAGTGTAGLVDGPKDQAQFSTPVDIVIVNNFMYVSDAMNNAIRRIDMNTGIVSTYIS
jgi:hypothetical protein